MQQLRILDHHWHQLLQIETQILDSGFESWILLVDGPVRDFRPLVVTVVVEVAVATSPRLPLPIRRPLDILTDSSTSSKVRIFPSMYINEDDLYARAMLGILNPDREIVSAESSPRCLSMSSAPRHFPIGLSGGAESPRM